MSMDLKKLDPMARKMRSHVDAFYKALEQQDGVSARSHITEVIKYADYLNKDIETTISKSDTVQVTGINDIYVGGVPVLKSGSAQNVHTAQNDVLPGMIRTTRAGPTHRRLSNRTV
jgi:hypothetical protein